MEERHNSTQHHDGHIRRFTRLDRSPKYEQKRFFRATAKKEMWPLLVGVTVGAFGAHYVCRAIVRMRNRPLLTFDGNNDGHSSRTPGPTYPIYGIDFGRSTSIVTRIDSPQAKPRIIPTLTGKFWTPSLACYRGNEEVPLVGENAERYLWTQPRDTVYAVQDLLHHEAGNGVAGGHDMFSRMGALPYEVEKKGEGVDEALYVVTGGQRRSVVEVAADILSGVREAAVDSSSPDDQVGGTTCRAVISVSAPPASASCPSHPPPSSSAAREGTAAAAEMAGIEVVGLVDESAAAWLGAEYLNLVPTLQGGGGGGGVGVVVDVGGMSTKLCVVRRDGEGVLQVVRRSVVEGMGGDAMDVVVCEYLDHAFRREHGVPSSLLQDPLALRRLREAVAEAKTELATSTSTQLSLPFISADMRGPMHLHQTLTRTMFDRIVSPVFSPPTGPSLTEACQALLRGGGAASGPSSSSASGGGDGEEVTVLLVGGSARLSLVQRLVTDAFQSSSSSSSSSRTGGSESGYGDVGRVVVAGGGWGGGGGCEAGGVGVLRGVCGGG